MPDTMYQLGEFYSWTILNENVAIKKTDKSFFVHHGSGVPMEIRWFFGAQHFSVGQKDIPVSLIFEGNSYNARLNLHKVGKVRIFWHSDLETELNKHFHGGEYPSVRFEKVERGVFRLEFIDEMMDDEEEQDPLESVFIPQIEGQKKEYYVTRYERKRENRLNAIKIHGTHCMICGFDFGEFYGEAGKGYIEVHHIVPLFEKDAEVAVNPETDLVCLCSNCHRMVHRKKNGVYSVDEVKKMVKSHS